MSRTFFRCVWTAWALAVFPAFLAPAAEYQIVDTLDVDTVPSWFPVGFSLLTHGDDQYAAYYNAEHQLIVAKRRIADRQWQRVPLPTRVGWDSHNYVTMTVDSAGAIHLAGNMHCVPLIYFRTQTPGDITTFQQLPMTGEEEQRCTYPRFLNDADGNLLFTYRSGSSGNGKRLYNCYDVATQTWSRFLTSPLFDGEGQRNAYPLGPVQGPDGWFHIVWVWRETPDCATNHDLSYARSPDLKQWESAGGVPVTLPMTLAETQLCVDPVPVGGGIINGCEKLAFDSTNRPMIAYHKSDDDGHMQIYVSRFEDGRWHRRCITAWDKAIEFSGGGAMPFIGISVGSFRELEPGTLGVSYHHRDYGSGRICLDEATLQPVDRSIVVPSEFPSDLSRTSIDFPGIRVKLASDSGEPAEPNTKYILRWQTLDANRDRPRDPPLPPASKLELLKLKSIE